jgi:hypothetical protein
MTKLLKIYTVLQKYTLNIQEIKEKKIDEL